MPALSPGPEVTCSGGGNFPRRRRVGGDIPFSSNPERVKRGEREGVLEQRRRKGQDGVRVWRLQNFWKIPL